MEIGVLAKWKLVLLMQLGRVVTIRVDRWKKYCIEELSPFSSNR
jgi:hypothetical protein